ncbi:MAG: hypothetical protein LBH15_06205 [Treponema sp.]|jgi:hypothetical protein|nr:hypothetical protein [Treponema sp.]
MPRAIVAGLSVALFLCLSPAPPAQEVLRGEVLIDLEPIFTAAEGVPYPHPIDMNTARNWALEEAALFFSAMIYGWSFSYEPGERARGIAGGFALESRGAVRFGDPGFFATDAEIRDGRLSLWADYRLTGPQKNRVRAWRAGLVRNLQATGYAALGEEAESGSAAPAAGEAAEAAEGRPADWIASKRAALEDAAETGIRALLRGRERNRPREARGFIALEEFPRYFMSGGRWAVSARFRVEVSEIIPFAAY